jgi:hypothetical protein
VRGLKVLVVVMGVLIVAGTVTLVTLIVQRAGQVGGGGAGSAGAPLALALDQPPGTRIGGIAAVGGGGGAGGDRAGGGLLAVWVTRPDGTDRVLVVDPRRGQVVGEIRPGAAAGAAAGGG